MNAELPPVGMRVEWEASPNGSRFIGTVQEHIHYAGRDALLVVGGARAIVYPEQLIKQPVLR